MAGYTAPTAFPGFLVETADKTFSTLLQKSPTRRAKARNKPARRRKFIISRQTFFALRC